MTVKTENGQVAAWSVLVHLGGKNYEYHFGAGDLHNAQECAAYFRRYNNVTVQLVDNEIGETT